MNRKLKLYIVDDQPENIEFLKDILEDNNYIVTGITDSTLAYDDIIKNVPDILLLDVSMPGIDGFTLCKKIKKDPKISHIPVFFISAYYKDRNYILKGYEAGAADYIRKPFILQELIARLDYTRKIIINEIKLKKLNEKLNNDIELAGSLMNLLNNQAQVCDKVDFSYIIQPNYKIGGDVLDHYYNNKTKTITFLVGDVSGHGIGSALLAAMCKSVFNIYIKENNSPSSFFNKFNKELFQLLEQKWFITAFMISIDLQNLKLTYCGAGHPPAFIFKANKKNKLLKSTHPPIFMHSYQYEYSDITIDISQNDILLLYTDGVYEARNKARELLGIKKLFLFFRKYLHELSLTECLLEYQNIILNHSSLIEDDYLMALIKIK